MLPGRFLLPSAPASGGFLNPCFLPASRMLPARFRLPSYALPDPADSCCFLLLPAAFLSPSCCLPPPASSLLPACFLSASCVLPGCFPRPLPQISDRHPSETAPAAFNIFCLRPLRVLETLYRTLEDSTLTFVAAVLIGSTPTRCENLPKSELAP